MDYLAYFSGPTLKWKGRLPMKKNRLISATLQGLASHGQLRLGKFWIIWVSRLLENAFVVIAQINMLTNTYMFIKAQAQSTCYLLQISLYIDLLIRNSTLSKNRSIASNLHTRIATISHWRKMSLSMQQDNSWYLKLVSAIFDQIFIFHHITAL